MKNSLNTLPNQSLSFNFKDLDKSIDDLKELRKQAIDIIEVLRTNHLLIDFVESGFGLGYYNVDSPNDYELFSIEWMGKDEITRDITWVNVSWKNTKYSYDESYLETVYFNIPINYFDWNITLKTKIAEIKDNIQLKKNGIDQKKEDQYKESLEKAKIDAEERKKRAEVFEQQEYLRLKNKFDKKEV